MFNIISTIIFFHNIFFYLFIFSGIIFFIVLKILHDKNSKYFEDIKSLQLQNAAKIDTLRKNHEDKVENLRNQMLKKEEDRTRQWAESEKEALHVLNGVSQILELSENLGKIESEKILNKLNEIKSIVEKKNTNE